MTGERGRGRPPGHVRLLDDPGRFEVAAWLALTEAGLPPYWAAYLVTFLLTSGRPITAESIDGVLLKLSTTHATTTIAGHADRIRRKAPQAIERADERELAWLTHSAGLLFALLKWTAKGHLAGFMVTVEALRQAGWTDVLARVGGRVDAALRSNFPPAEGPLSRAAARLLRKMQHPTKK